MIISFFIEETGLRVCHPQDNSFCVAALGRRSPVHSLLTSVLPSNTHYSHRTQSPELSVQTCKPLFCIKPSLLCFSNIIVKHKPRYTVTGLQYYEWLKVYLYISIKKCYWIFEIYCSTCNILQYIAKTLWTPCITHKPFPNWPQSWKHTVAQDVNCSFSISL